MLVLGVLIESGTKISFSGEQIFGDGYWYMVIRVVEDNGHYCGIAIPISVGVTPKWQAYGTGWNDF